MYAVDRNTNPKIQEQVTIPKYKVREGTLLREIFKNQDRDFLRPGTRRGGAGSERGKKGHEGFLKKCFFKNHIESF